MESKYVGHLYRDGELVKSMSISGPVPDVRLPIWNPGFEMEVFALDKEESVLIFGDTKWHYIVYRYCGTM